MGIGRRTSGWRIRLGVLLLLGGWIALSPAYRQVFGGKSTWAPRWVMFHGFGRQVCDVRFFEMVEGVDGKSRRQKIDRFEVMNEERNWFTNKELIRMENKDEAVKVGRRLCLKLGPGADLRVLARCGSQGFWKAKLDGKTNLCTKKSLSPMFLPRGLR